MLADLEVTRNVPEEAAAVSSYEWPSQEHIMATAKHLTHDLRSSRRKRRAGLARNHRRVRR